LPEPVVAAAQLLHEAPVFQSPARNHNSTTTSLRTMISCSHALIPQLYVLMHTHYTHYTVCAHTQQLLAGFFRYFAAEFDCKHCIVSLRSGAATSKEVKAETDGWSSHTRLSIEDPFETWYDVAHVLKWSR
jgi:hypothetical protein